VTPWRGLRRRPIAVAGAAALAVATLGSTITDLGPWYQSLRKPDWQPPDPVFAIAWTTIFALAAASAAIAWRAAPRGAAREWLVIAYALNGFLNLLWSLLFFRLQRPDWALIEVCFLWLSIVAMIIVAARHSALASVLLIPYLVWVSVASALNFDVVRLNAPFG